MVLSLSLSRHKFQTTYNYGVQTASQAPEANFGEK